MGYAIVISPCIACGRTFAYNPMRVPSIRVNGHREPVCRPCVEAANPIREEKGLEPFVIHPDAYEPCHEDELG